MRTTGTVRWYDGLRGRGIVGRDSGEHDCFFHVSVTDGLAPLASCARVEFDVVQTPAGWMAANLAAIRPVALGRSSPKVGIRGAGPRRLFRNGSRPLRFGRL